MVDVVLDKVAPVRLELIVPNAVLEDVKVIVIGTVCVADPELAIDIDKLTVDAVIVLGLIDDIEISGVIFAKLADCCKVMIFAWSVAICVFNDVILASSVANSVCSDVKLACNVVMAVDEDKPEIDDCRFLISACIALMELFTVVRVCNCVSSVCNLLVSVSASDLAVLAVLTAESDCVLAELAVFVAVVKLAVIVAI